MGLAGWGMINHASSPVLATDPQHPLADTRASNRASCKPRESLPLGLNGVSFCPGWRITLNAINVIAPYKHLGMWVFDDPRVGLNQEPFVAGADAMIDRVVADIPNAEHGFTLIFAASPLSTSSGYVLMRTAVIGIVARTWIWRAGSARPCFDISIKRRSNFMRG